MSETLLSFMAYGILVAGKQMTSRGLSYTANAGFFDESCGVARIILTGTMGDADSRRGRIRASLSWAKELFLLRKISEPRSGALSFRCMQTGAKRSVAVC